MPLWNLDIEKTYLNNYWTNRYILSAATLAAAQAVGEDIVALEQAIHAATTEFTKFRVSDQAPNTDNYIVVAVNGFGTVAVSSGFLPLFNVVRCDFVPGSGRPSRKYLRLPLQEDNVANFALEGAFRTHINTNYVNPLIAIPEFVDPQGATITGGSTFPRVGMRQLRRGSKRQTEPVLP